MKTVTLFAMMRTALALTLPTFATPHTPAKGSSERTVIMNSLRRVLGSGRHKAIITPRAFYVERGWAYVTGNFDYAGAAPLEPQFTEGPGSNFSALLHKEGGRWRIKRRIYNGDVVLPEFVRDFPQAPPAIFQDK